MVIYYWYMISFKYLIKYLIFLVLVAGQSLEGSVKLGKLDCQAYQWVCRGAGVNAYPSVVFYEGLDARDPSGTATGDRYNRQNPRGEMLQSLQPQTILSHVLWRLEDSKSNQRSQRLKDEL